MAFDSFNTGFLPDPERVGGGELLDPNGITVSLSNYEDGLVIGRFARVDEVTGEIKNIIDAVDLRVGGVVLNKDSYPVEINVISDASFLPNKRPQAIDLSVRGLVTVQVVSGLTIIPFQQVFVDVTGALNGGKATNVPSAHQAGARFLE